MRLISLFVLLVLLSSCKKDDPTVEDGNIIISNGMMVLCEGLFQQNNSTLSWVNNSNGNVINDYYLQTSGLQLGDTGNDMKIYGGKIYIAMNGSSTIEVLSALTGVSITQIPMFDGPIAKEPRSIAFYDGKAYVTCYDGYVDVIDTSSLEIEQRIQVGTNPEGITVANGKLFVANSGGLNFPNVDSTVSVINPITSMEIMKITVGLNPGSIITDVQGDVYVITRGDYASIPSRMHRINSASNVVLDDFDFDASSMSLMNSNLLVGYSDFVGGTNSIGLFNTISETMSASDFVDLSNVETVYGIEYNSSNDRIYIMDAMDFTTTGYVRTFSSAGLPLSDFHVGLNPSEIIFFD